MQNIYTSGSKSFLSFVGLGCNWSNDKKKLSIFIEFKAVGNIPSKHMMQSIYFSLPLYYYTTTLQKVMTFIILKSVGTLDIRAKTIIYHNILKL